MPAVEHQQQLPAQLQDAGADGGIGQRVAEPQQQGRQVGGGLDGVDHPARVAQPCAEEAQRVGGLGTRGGGGRGGGGHRRCHWGGHGGGEHGLAAGGSHRLQHADQLDALRVIAQGGDGARDLGIAGAGRRWRGCWRGRCQRGGGLWRRMGAPGLALGDGRGGPQQQKQQRNDEFHRQCTSFRLALGSSRDRMVAAAGRYVRGFMRAVLGSPVAEPVGASFPFQRGGMAQDRLRPAEKPASWCSTSPGSTASGPARP